MNYDFFFSSDTNLGVYNGVHIVDKDKMEGVYTYMYR
jgi:hypothetical protein